MSPENHEHAKTGMDFGLVQQGIRVFRVRPGREFSPDDAERLVPKVKMWVQRELERTTVAGMEPMLDSRTFSMWQDSKHDTLVVVFRVIMGFAPEFVCYANQYLSGDEDGVPTPDLTPTEVMAALAEMSKREVH